MRISASVAIIGGFGLGNFGDDLLMLATRNAVRRVVEPREITVLLYPGGTRYAPRLDGALRYVERRQPIELDAEVVVLGGGTQFYGFGSKQLRRSRRQRALRFVQAVRQGRMSWRNLWTTSNTGVSILPGSRQAAVSLGLGPFLNDPSEQRARSAVGRCEYLAVRDARSLDYCQRWGLTHARLRSDWGFAPSMWDGALPPDSGPRTAGRIGIVVRDWYKSAEGFAHLHASLDLAKRLRREGRDVQFFVFDACEDTTCLAELKRHRESAVVWRPEQMQVVDFLKKLRDCSVLITSRAHGAIVGATLGLPVICVEIEPKLNIMATSLGAAAECWRPPFPVEQGRACVAALEGRREEASDVALSMSRQHASSAEQAAEELAAFVQQCMPPSHLESGGLIA